MRDASDHNEFVHTQLGYRKTWKVFAIALALATVCIATFIAIQEQSWLAFTLTVVFFGAMLGPLFLEFWGVKIEWDAQNIRTYSPWRRTREIPMAAVTSCDFSIWLQWYRVHTKGYGTIRVHTYMSDIAAFLSALPCSTPPWPPPITFKEAANNPIHGSGEASPS